MPAQSTYSPEVDGLRAIAVMSVLLFHTGFYRFNGGFVGVDIFFVISGYLITRIIVAEVEKTGRFRYGPFLMRRVRRIAPALLATCALTFLGAALIFSPGDFGQFSASLVAAITSTSNMYLWAQSGYFDAASHTKPLLHTWSLSVEEQFYFVWPLFIAAAAALRRSLVLPAVLAAFAVSLGANLVSQGGFDGMPVYPTNFADGASLIFYWMPFRIFEFAIGAALLWLIDIPVPKIARELAFWTGLLAIAYSVRFFDDATVFPSLNGLAPCLGAALIIFGARGTQSGWLLRNRLAVGVGLISYSLYLVHWPIIVFYEYLKFHPLGDFDRPLIITLSFAAALPMYWFVETPFRRGGEMRLQNGAILKMAGAVSVVLLILSATSLGGWGWRSPAAAVLESPMASYGGGDCTLSHCTHGSTGKTVFVVGDSFSRQLYEGLVTEFPEQRFEFLDTNVCTFFSPTWSRWEALPDQEENCKGQRGPLFEKLRNADKIIFAANWVRQDYFDVTDEGPVTESQKHFATMDDELAAFTFEELKKLQSYLQFKDAIVVTNPPSIGDIPTLQACLGRPIRLVNATCEYAPETEVRSRHYLARYPSPTFPVLDPYEAFCTADKCANLSSDGPFYSDHWHLSQLGSVHLIRHFRSQIANWLQT